MLLIKFITNKTTALCAYKNPQKQTQRIVYVIRKVKNACKTRIM